MTILQAVGLPPDTAIGSTSDAPVGCGTDAGMALQVPCGPGPVRQEGSELPRCVTARMCAPVVPATVASGHFEIVTKNRARERDPEMHQTKKGNKWSFGMKVHIGADEETGVVHSVVMTSANVHDVTETHRLLHGGETRVWGDAGYQGVDKREENRELDVEWRVAMKPGRRRQLAPESEEALAEKRKASVRAKVEHPFLYVKRHFGYAKVRYRGLAKNTQRLALLLGFANLMTAERHLAV